MSSAQGRPGKDACLVIGSVITKHKLNLNDKETVLKIKENSYLQYFVGFTSYSEKPPFTPSLFVEIHKRVEGAVFSSFEQAILNHIDEKKKRHQSKIAEEPEKSKNKGKSSFDFPTAHHTAGLL